MMNRVEVFMYRLMACVGKVQCFISKSDDFERLRETARRISPALPNRAFVILKEEETVWRCEPADTPEAPQSDRI